MEKNLFFFLPSRFVWNYFRLENEHLNNCGKFRAVRDISLAPLDTSDQLAILRMMDHPDGAIINRHHGLQHAWKKTNSLLHHYHSNHHNVGGSFHQGNNGSAHRRVMSIMTNARPQIRILLRGERYRVKIFLLLHIKLSLTS